jgi:hypothetical protein
MRLLTPTMGRAIVELHESGDAMIPRQPLVVVCVLTTACHSMSRVSEPTQDSGRTYAIRFDPARTIETRSATGAPLSFEGVSEARVRTTGLVGDSVTVQIVSWNGGTSGEADHDGSGAQAIFSRADPGLSFYERRMSMKKNLLLAGVIAGGIALAAGQASVAGGGGSWNVGGYFRPRF